MCLWPKPERGTGHGSQWVFYKWHGLILLLRVDSGIPALCPHLVWYTASCPWLLEPGFSGYHWEVAPGLAAGCSFLYSCSFIPANSKVCSCSVVLWRHLEIGGAKGNLFYYNKRGFNEHLAGQWCNVRGCPPNMKYSSKTMSMVPNERCQPNVAVNLYWSGPSGSQSHLHT